MYIMKTDRKPAPIKRPPRHGDGICIKFFWREAMFGVQVDYPDDTPEQRLLNRLDDESLRRDGIEIMRIGEDEINNHPEKVVAQIQEALERRTPAGMTY
jgi:very-short-patch-repair endonuclease